jgi:hypothetical protein
MIREKTKQVIILQILQILKKGKICRTAIKNIKTTSLLTA